MNNYNTAEQKLSRAHKLADNRPASAVDAHATLRPKASSANTRTGVTYKSVGKALLSARAGQLTRAVYVSSNLSAVTSVTFPYLQAASCTLSGRGRRLPRAPGLSATSLTVDRRDSAGVMPDVSRAKYLQCDCEET